MAETYSTEEQEIEAVKQWWKENGLPIVLGLVIGLGGLFGWRGYQAHQEQQAVAASDLYSAMLVQVRQQESDNAQGLAEKIVAEYQDTKYAVFSSMILAKMAIEDADYAAAKQHLQFAKDNAGDDELQALADLRLARVAYAEGNFEQTQKLLDSVKGDAYIASVAELKGDIFTQQGDLSKAREEYALALSKSTADTGNYKILEMKLDSVGNSIN